MLCKPCDLARRKSTQTQQEYKRDWNRRKKYNLEPVEFEALWIAFKGRCGICGGEMKMPAPKRGQALDVVSIDHDHATGTVRGLLCNACNKGLGLFHDDIIKLRKAIQWLEMCNEKISNNSQNQ